MPPDPAMKAGTPSLADEVFSGVVKILSWVTLVYTSAQNRNSLTSARCRFAVYFIALCMMSWETLRLWLNSVDKTIFKFEIFFYLFLSWSIFLQFCLLVSICLKISILKVLYIYIYHENFYLYYNCNRQNYQKWIIMNRTSKSLIWKNGGHHMSALFICFSPICCRSGAMYNIYCFEYRVVFLLDCSPTYLTNSWGGGEEMESYPFLGYLAISG